MKWMTSILLATALMVVAACSTAPKSNEGRNELESKAAATVARFKQTDSSMNERFFNTAKAYAVFPTIGKGAVGVGGAYGKGVLYQGGQAIGYCDMSQGSIGFQLGGQAYSEIVFFQSEKDLAQFKAGDMEFAAQASAVAAAADASANADYDNGVAVFTLAAKGLMYEASIGGQRFTFVGK